LLPPPQAVSNPPVVQEKPKRPPEASAKPLSKTVVPPKVHKQVTNTPVLASQKPIQRIDRTHAMLLRINALLQNNDLNKADSALAGLSSTDGYYYLLKAQLLMRRDKFLEAIETLKMAQDHPSQYVNNVSGEAVFLWAQSLEALFQQKPNLENKRSYERAYQKYLDGFCLNNTGGEHCRIAREKTIGVAF
jgi:tetratricopeptide (TPR) repeat protein